MASRILFFQALIVYGFSALEISQPKTIKEYFPMEIMCCFLHDILKMKFEDLNLMCFCAKPNKYYNTYVKFDQLSSIVAGLLKTYSLVYYSSLPVNPIFIQPNYFLILRNSTFF